MEKKMDEAQKKLKFIMFENETNSCWLDASISLVVHLKTFKKIVKSFPESRINKIISSYDEAITALNKPECASQQKVLMKAKEMLQELQQDSLEYLKQFLKFKTGEPDSAFNALLSLIHHDQSNIKEQLNVTWIWKKHCTKCGLKLNSVNKKPIITFSNLHNFHPECPSSIYTCNCKSEQMMKLIYKELPSCLIFHFEKGAGSGTNFPTSFSISSREYKLTGIVVLEKGSDSNNNHFFTLIRNPRNNWWLECNDLEKKCVSFSPVKPEIKLKDVCICVFEAFDNLDKINNEVSIDSDQEVENSNVELIDLSDENEGADNTDVSSKTKAAKLRESNTAVKLSQEDVNSETDLDTKDLSTCDKTNKPSVLIENAETSTNDESEESETESDSSDSSSDIELPSDSSSTTNPNSGSSFTESEADRRRQRIQSILQGVFCNFYEQIFLNNPEEKD